MPAPEVALACGSMSTSSVRRSAAARLAQRLTAVVVLPTPPFWLVTAMIFPMVSYGVQLGGVVNGFAVSHGSVSTRVCTSTGASSESWMVASMADWLVAPK